MQQVTDCTKKSFRIYLSICNSTGLVENNETNDKFSGKVAFICYAEIDNFRCQSLKTASKQKPHQGLGDRLPSS